MTLSEFLHKTIQVTSFAVRPQIICKDGFKMSVQGSKGHYCRPRIMSDLYSHMEIGFPSVKEDALMKYAESPEAPTGTVYGYVPVETIEFVIEKRGGIDVEKTFNS